MKRPFGVTASAVFALLGSLGLAVVSILLGLAMFSDTPVPPEMKTGLRVMLIPLGAFSIWGVTTAIGLFRLRNWARISTAAFGVFLAFATVFSYPLVLLFPATASAPTHSRVATGTAAAAYVALAMLGCSWLYYFNRRVTLQLFNDPTVDKVRPLSVFIIGWCTLIGGLSAPVNVLSGTPIAIFAWVFAGPAAVALHLALGSYLAYVGYCLLRLKPHARKLAIWTLGFAAVSYTFFCLAPGRDARFAALTLRPSHPVPFPVLILLTVLIMIAVPLGFLIAAKPSFDRASAPSADSP